MGAAEAQILLDAAVSWCLPLEMFKCTPKEDTFPKGSQTLCLSTLPPPSEPACALGASIQPETLAMAFKLWIRSEGWHNLSWKASILGCQPLIWGHGRR